MKNFLTLFFLMAVLSTAAQEVQHTSNKKRTPKLTFKWSPFHLLVNRFPTIQIAVEQRIGNNYALVYDFGPIVNFKLDQEQPEAMVSTRLFDKSGFKAKLELRRYLTGTDHLWLPYISSELYYNYVNYSKSEKYAAGCEDGTCDYYRFFTYKMEYREPGLNVKGGVMFRAHRFCLDFQVGISARFINYDAIGKQSTSGYILYSDYSLEDEGNLFEVNERDRFIFSPTACVRIGYVIK
jgi:hypothetical protein